MKKSAFTLAPVIASARKQKHAVIASALNKKCAVIVSVAKQSRKNVAFTLAEVLITLAIIGVVAALTIPSVVSNNRKQQQVVAFQTAYNTVNKAVQMSVAQNGDVANWNFPTPKSAATNLAFGDKYIVPYLNILKNCGIQAGQGCFKKGQTYKYLNGNYWSIMDNDNDAYKVRLADGTSICFAYNTGCIGNPPHNCMFFHVDVNGDKGPNQHGRDTFGFFLLPYTNQLLPTGSVDWGAEPRFNGTSWATNTKEQIYANCDPATTATQDDSCSARIVIDGWKMNY